MREPVQKSFRIKAGVVESAVGDEIILLCLTKSTYFGLDFVGARIWADLRSGRKLPEIRDALVADFGKSADEIETDLCNFLAELERNDLVEIA